MGLAVCGLVLGAGALDAATTVSGDIDRETVWSIEGSPYRVTDDLRLVDGVTLRIEPGVVVEVSPEKSITIDGLLIAVGEENNPILFTRESSEAWGVLHFSDYSDDAVVDDDLHYVSGSVMQHCIVEHGSGILCRYGSPLISNCTIRRHQSSGIRVEHGAPVIVDNEIYENSTESDPAAGNGAGIIAFTNKQMTISRNVVRDNRSVDGRFGGGGICAYGDETAAITITGNKVLHNYSSTDAGGIFAYNSVVKDNLVAGNRCELNGGGINAIDSVVTDNVVDSNEGAGGGGIYAEKSELSSNSIVRNHSRSTFGGGVYFFGSGTITYNTVAHNVSAGPSKSAGIYISGDPILAYNTIRANRKYGLYTGNPAQSPILDARNNYWGSSNGEPVPAELYDWFDDSERGLVDYSGQLSRADHRAPPEPPAALTAVFVGREIEARWSPNPDAGDLVYTVHVSRDHRYPLGVGFDASALDSVRVPISRRKHGDTYYVSVSARRRNGKGWGDRSALSERLELVYTDRKARPPEQPANRSPAADVTGVSPQPTLTASPFSDLNGDAQAASRWQITSTAGDYSAPVFDSGPTSEAMESYRVPDGVLENGKRYFWRVSYRDESGNWSRWSRQTPFSTEKRPASLIEGRISASASWSLEESPYVLIGNTLIGEGEHLTIAPGVTVRLEPGVAFMVRGKLVAVGTEEKRITFTKHGDGPWGRFIFAATSADAVFDDSGSFLEGTTLEHVVMEYGGGIVVDEASPLVTDSVIRHHQGSGITIRNGGPTVLRNRVVDNHTDREGGGIYVYTNDLARIEDNFIGANSAGADGGGIFAYGYTSTTAIRMRGNEISGNSSGGNGGGIYASRATISGNRIYGNKADSTGGGIYTTFSIVDGNALKANTAAEGGGIYAERNSTIRYNQVSENQSSSSYGGGVYINYWGRSAENEVFSFNDVTKNRAVPDGATGGVFVKGSLIFEKNNIFGNVGYQLYNGNSAELPTLKASDCYWGSDDPDNIEAAIFHSTDDERLGLVAFEPYALEVRGERDLP